MSYSESIARIKPFPEVQEAVQNLAKCRGLGTLTIIKDYKMYWANGCEVIQNEDGSFADPEIAEGAGDLEDWKTEIIGMPFIRLYFYPKPNQHKYDLLLWFEIPKNSGDDSPSMYSLFYQSRYFSLFHEDYESNGIMNVSLWILDKDIELAAKLISYYIRYYGIEDVSELEISIDDAADEQ